MSFVLGGDRQLRKHRRPIPELNKAQWGQSIAVDDPAQWMDAALEDVNRLGILQRGWDGGNSPPPSVEVLELARAIVIKAADTTNVMAPHIGPVPGGGIQLEWHTGARDLELEILPNGSLAYLLSNNDRQDDGVLSVERVDSARELIEWLTQ
jgi:hypothetical protein